MTDILELLLAPLEEEAEREDVLLSRVRITSNRNPQKNAQPHHEQTGTTAQGEAQAVTAMPNGIAEQIGAWQSLPPTNANTSELRDAPESLAKAFPAPNAPDLAGRMAHLQRSLRRQTSNHLESSTESLRSDSSNFPSAPIGTGRGRASYVTVVDTAFARDARRYDCPVRML